MKNIVFAAAVLAALAAGGCKKRQPENIPQPKTGDGAAVAASSAAPVGLLEAPGAYLKTTVGQVDKAKAAAAVYEKAASGSLGAANDPGGN